MQWRVHKFGGSSVADAACMERVARILEADPNQHLGVVLSACRGVTDVLLNLVTAAENQDSTLQAQIDAVRTRHKTIAETLLPSPDHERSRAEYLAQLEQD